jgi:hypothetical protein
VDAEILKDIPVNDQKLQTFAAQIRESRGSGNKIKTVKDIVLCYYSGIQIICIPHKKYANAASLGKHLTCPASTTELETTLLIRQYYRLHKAITDATNTACSYRRNSEILMNSDELDSFLADAFNHFSYHPNIPFNFLSAAFKRNPVRSTFATHILDMAILMMHSDIPYKSSGEVFQELSEFVASCILLEVCRKSYPQKCMQVATTFEV